MTASNTDSQQPRTGGRPRKKPNGAERPPFPRIWLDEVRADLTTDYLIKGVIDRGRLHVVYGPPNCGKTFFVADMAGRIAAGQPWRDRRVRSGLVVYVAAEAGASIVRRFFAWRERHLSEDRDGRTPLAILTRGPNLLKAADVGALMEELHAVASEAAMPVALVVFDTLARVIPGGLENSPEDMGSVIAASDWIRDDLGAATLFVHHSGKDAGKGARGHSSLLGAADVVINVSERIATIEKARDAAMGSDTAFPFALDVIEVGRDQDGDLITTCTIRHTDASPQIAAKARLTNTEQAALDALREAISLSGIDLQPTSVIPRTRGVRLEEWREAFYRRSGEEVDRSSGPQVKAFGRAKEGLLAKRAIGASAPWVWIR